MLILEEGGYSMMLTSITKDDIEVFEVWLKKSQYNRWTSCSCYEILQNNIKVNVLIVKCDSKDGRSDITEYWNKKGFS